jgi:hypothetical protein
MPLPAAYFQPCILLSSKIIFMPVKHLEEIKKIDKKATAFIKAVNEANNGNTKLINEFLLKIHQPGWTTIADIGFVNTHLDSLMGQLKNMNEQIAGFTKAASLVAFSKEPVLN